MLFSWEIYAQTPEVPVAQTSVFCEKCAQIPDYERIFNPQTPIVLPNGMTQDQVVRAFCDACQTIDTCLAEIDTLKQQLQKSETIQTEKIQTQIRVLELQTHSLYHQTMDWIGPVWRFAPQEPDVMRYMLFLLASTMESDQFEAAYIISRELMLQKVYESEPFLYEMAGISAFMMNKFDVAKLCFTEAQQNNILSGTAGAYLELIPYYVQAWKTEQALRRQEAFKGNLPRVLLETTKGEVEIELFADSAPETVKTFLELVNQKFYDDNEFSTVLPGLFAQTGKTAKDIQIPDEFNRANVRKHFRGSVVMTHGEKPNSGASRFFIMFAPAMQLDGKFTVFGRVVSGMENVSALERVSRNHSDGKTPDKIIRARVLSQPIPELTGRTKTVNPEK